MAEHEMRAPFMASAVDAARNVAGAFNTGWNIPNMIKQRDVFNNVGKSSYGLLNMNPGHLPETSIGGMLTLGGLGGAGAAAGAVAGAILSPDNLAQGAGTGAAIGLGIGLAAVPAAGLAARGAVGAMGLIGGGVMNLAKAPLGGAGLIGKAAEMAGGAINGFASEGLLASAFSPVRRYANTAGKIMDNIVVNKPGKGGLGVGLSKTGFALFGGTALASGMIKGFDTMQRAHMGQMDGQITRATPRIPAYSDNAGASGDLVFALNNLRRG